MKLYLFVLFLSCLLVGPASIAEDRIPGFRCQSEAVPYAGMENTWLNLYVGRVSRLDDFSHATCTLTQTFMSGAVVLSKTTPCKDISIFNSQFLFNRDIALEIELNKYDENGYSAVANLTSVEGVKYFTDKSRVPFTCHFGSFRAPR